MTKTTPEAQALLNAAKIVRKRWQQGDLGFVGGPRCALGAIDEATYNLSVSHDAHILLVRYLKGSAVEFNDAPDRTAEEVAKAMEAAALGGS